MFSMNSSMIGFLSVFFTVYAAANFYVGYRLLHAFRSWLEPYVLVYWLGYVMIAASPFIARLGKNYFSSGLHDTISIIGGYWMAAVYYLFLSWVVADLVRLAAKLFAPSSQLFRQHASGLGFGVLLLVAVLLAYGTWNALHPRIQHYDITIRKNTPNIHKLRAVMVSDVHLGVVVGNDRLASMVKSINSLSPDIVFFAGDIIDEDVTLFIEQKMPAVLNGLKAKYGVFAVLGNHEYIGGNSLLAVDHLNQAGVKVLRDDSVKVADAFYVVGRDDRSSARATGRPRPELAKIMSGLDRSLPIFLLDHQPYNLAEGQRAGVDLQLSGHTHHGQFFPNHFVTERIFEIDWGYLRKEDFQVIVSCGFGTWGPPIRLGNQPEIIDITITFAK